MSDADVGLAPPGELSDSDVGVSSGPTFDERFSGEPDKPPVPQSFLDRLKAGDFLKKFGGWGDIGGALPEATADVRHTLEGVVVSSLAKSAWEQFTLPHRVMTGEVDLKTEEGADEAVGMGVGIALGRMNRLPGNAEGVPLMTRADGNFTRPHVDDGGQRQLTAVGGLPTKEDFANGGKVLDSPHAETNLKRMWEEDGVHPAEAVHDAQADAFYRHEITAPREEMKFIPEARREPTAPDPLDLAMSGELTAVRAKTIADDLTQQQRKVEEEIFGERADEWRKLNKQSDRAWDNADDAKAKDLDTRISKLEEDVGLTEADENWLNGQGWNNQSVPDHWEKLSQNLNDVELGRQDALGVVASEVRYLPKHNDWPEMTSGEQESVITILSAMNAEKVAGRDPMAFLKEAFQQRVRRYGGGADANEVAQYQMQELAELLRNPLKRGPKTTEVHMPPEEIELISGGKPLSLSAAMTEPGDIPLDVQPASPPSSLIASAQAATEKLFDIGRDIQMKLAPMARGSVESMATVKDYMNSMRRNSWDWSRIDTDLQKRFTPEDRARMWNAMDEESLSLRLNEPESARAHQGLNTLEPEARQAVVDLDTRQQLAWLRARDLGMVEGDGIAMHAPRIGINLPKGSMTGEGAMPWDALGYDLRTRTPGMKHRKYVEVEETERALKAKFGDQAVVARDIRTVALSTAQIEDAIAGRSLIENIKDVGKRTGEEVVAEGFQPDKSWFTVDHPAFKTWRPKLAEVEGKMEAVKDSAGNTVFEQVPIYVRGDFEGPLRSAMWGKTGETYGAMMSLKGKTMGLIMNSPMIHNLVEFGRAFPAMPIKMMTFRTYVDGYRAKYNPMIMHEAIDAGLVPIGKRFFNQDITSIMESPDLTPGRSWTAKVAAAVPGLFDEAAGTAVKRAIDKAGDFWHNTLLWDRIGDLQTGLYVNFRSDMIAKGMDQTTASRVAAHFANRYAGALPKEAMSEAATKAANFMLFSRSFTLGNLGVMKDMLTGLPKDVLAQIERDAGFRAGSINEAGELNGPAVMAVTTAKSMARRKAIAVVGLDIALMYVGNSVLQSAFNVMLGDNTLSQEGHEYLRRVQAVLNEAKVHPLSLLNPFGVAERLSATSDNEPGRKDRVMIGYAKDGTAIYARNPVGKIGEEFSGYFGSPIDMLRKKQGTIARPLMQIYSNDAGFGRKVYDPTADTPAKYAGNIWAIVKHLVGSQLPEGQITAFSDLVGVHPSKMLKGESPFTGPEGDAKVNALQAFGPFAGVTFSKGAPGGPAVGEMYASKSQYQFAVDQALPDIRRQIRRGDIDGAQQRMTELKVPPSLQRFYIKTTQNPALRMSPRAVRDFYQHATPEQRDRFDRARQAAPPQ